jgi:hypothetical protein
MTGIAGCCATKPLVSQVGVSPVKVATTALIFLLQFSLEPVSKSFEEDNEASKLDKAEEIVGVVLPANEDPQGATAAKL